MLFNDKKVIYESKQELEKNATWLTPYDNDPGRYNSQ
jgi:hypothetical protein